MTIGPTIRKRFLVRVRIAAWGFLITLLIGAPATNHLMSTCTSDFAAGMSAVHLQVLARGVNGLTGFLNGRAVVDFDNR